MNNKKILIADDDESIVEAVKIVLEDEGYSVKTTVNGEDLYEITDYPDLFLIDIWLSGHNGRDICRYLKSKKETSSTPVIIISANKDTEDIAKTAGADAFLLKPFEIDDLVSLVVKFTS